MSTNILEKFLNLEFIIKLINFFLDYTILIKKKTDNVVPDFT